jgi:hypothetical protein
VQSNSPGTLLVCSAQALATSLSLSGARLFIGHERGGISCREVRPATQTCLETGNVRVTRCINRRECPQKSELNGGLTDEQLSRLGYGHFRDDGRRSRSSRSARPGNKSRNRVSQRSYRDGIRDDRHHEHRARLRRRCPDRLCPGLHPDPGTPGPARRSRRGALPGDHHRDRQHPRRPAQAARGPGQAAGRRHAGDLQAGPSRPVHEGTARAAGRPSCTPAGSTCTS